MDPRIAQYLNREAGFPVSLGLERRQSQPGPLFAAWLTEFPGCIAQGASETEALDRLAAIAPEFLQQMLDLGQELPTEPPGLYPGFIQFYEAGAAGILGISEKRRMEKTAVTAQSADDAQTLTGEPVAA